MSLQNLQLWDTCLKYFDSEDQSQRNDSNLISSSGSSQGDQEFNNYKQYQNEQLVKTEKTYMDDFYDIQQENQIELKQKSSLQNNSTSPFILSLKSPQIQNVNMNSTTYASKRGRKPKNQLGTYTTEQSQSNCDHQNNQDQDKKFLVSTGNTQSKRPYNRQAPPRMKKNQQYETKLISQSQIKSSNWESQNLLGQISKLANYSKQVENLNENLYSTVKQVISQIKKVSDTIMNTLESKLSKLSLNNVKSDIKNEQSQPNQEDISIYCTSQNPLITSMEACLQRYVSIMKPLSEEKIPKFQFNQTLEIVNSEIQITGMQFKYDQLLQQISDDIIVMKRSNEDLADILKLEVKSNSSLAKCQILTSIPQIPKYVIIDQDRVVVDGYIFDNKNQQLINQLPTEIVSGAQVCPGLIIVGLPSFTKVEIRQWNGNQYEIIHKGQVRKSNAQVQRSYYVKFKLSPFKDYGCNNIFSNEIFTITNFQQLDKVQLNQQKFDNSQRTKLVGQKVLDFQFIDTQHLLAISEDEVCLVNYENGQNLQQFKLAQNDFIALPFQINMVKLPIMVHINSEKNQAKVVDLLKQGFQGQKQLDQQLNYYGNIQMGVDGSKSQIQSHLLAVDYQNNMVIQNFQVN
ncbi:hypothetical protein OXYTRIMIC_498 [Oxytricha trifallax]|uniref:Uncharacterized protein n=1 Tax=Oxytricha trifallax TaxID=1172189 RepID=A0A073I111_9SPIT|nr:hypothetical protein OXYTRIMIC_498 [Oxytricha trifallax]